VKRLRIAAPQEFWSGLVLLAVCAGAWALSANLSGMRGNQLGAGVTVRLFIGLLALSALVVVVRSLLIAGPALPRLALRGPLLLTAAVLFFSFAIRPLGLGLTCFGTTFLAALASREMRLHEAVIVSVLLTVFALGAFHYALRLPISPWPSL